MCTTILMVLYESSSVIGLCREWIRTVIGLLAYELCCTIGVPVGVVMLYNIGLWVEHLGTKKTDIVCFLCVTLGA